MVLHANDHGSVDRGVELAVSSVIDAVLAAGHPRARWYGAYASEFCECGFAFDAFGVVACDDEDLGGGVNTDAELVEEVWGALGDELFDLCVEFLDLFVQSDPAFRDRAQRVPVGVIGCRQVPWAQVSAVSGDHHLGFPSGVLAQFGLAPF